MKKYLSITQIRESLQFLQPHHPFFAITFLVLKKEGAPVGSKGRFKLDALNDEFLQRYYRAHPKSQSFFRVMRKGTSLNKDWVKPKYAATGLQSVNTRGMREALLHDRDDDTWGWSSEYVEALAKHLPKGKRVPLFHLAAWLFRDRAWPEQTKRNDLVTTLIREFFLTQKELLVLFDRDIVSEIAENDAFQDSPARWYEILEGYDAPEDVPPEGSGVLTYLEVNSIGALDHAMFEPSRRLNIVTGDNGLGKTFLLDLAWWALTQDWADRPAWPRHPTRRDGAIKFAVGASTPSRVIKARWNPSSSEWTLPERSAAISGLVIYARVDGSFAVWDPANTIFKGTEFKVADDRRIWPGVKFTREDVWDGTSRIEGLIRDWVKWQEVPAKYPFAEFEAVLKRVSPPDLGPLRSGSPMRLPGEIREIPTLVHPYGEVPILFASAGIKRIVTIAYLIVWAWQEHKVQAKQAGRPEERQMVVIIDEVEAHLHPKWQRVILPALMGIASDLSPELSMQMLVASHSPLVLASSEPVFNPEQDRLFHMDLSPNGKVTVQHVPFELRGSPDSWLSSRVFEIAIPGSPQREAAIKKAIALQVEAVPSTRMIRKVSNELREHLPPEDPFWARWVFFAQDHGVSL